MSFRSILTVSNIVFILGTIYFAVLVATRESSIYAIVPAILCLISFGLAIREDLVFSSPFRLGTCIFVLVLLVAQEYAALSSSFMNLFVVATIVVNGAFFLLFLGTTLAVTKEIAKVKSDEEEEEAEEPRAVSKQVRQIG